MSDCFDPPDTVREIKKQQKELDRLVRWFKVPRKVVDIRNNDAHLCLLVDNAWAFARMVDKNTGSVGLGKRIVTDDRVAFIRGFLYSFAWEASTNFTAYFFHELDLEYVIRSKTETEEDGFLYWNNTDGWVDHDSATRFTALEKSTFEHIPKGGVWEVWTEEAPE